MIIKPYLFNLLKCKTQIINKTINTTPFIFKIESTGALPAERIVMEAAKILDNEVKEFSNKLKKGNKT